MTKLKFKIQFWLAKKFFQLSCKLSRKRPVGIALENISTGDIASQRMTDGSIMLMSPNDF